MKITDSVLITSKDNPRLKLVRAVRDGRDKSMIFVEGMRLVSELLKSGVKAKTVLVADDSAEKSDELVSKLFLSGKTEVLNVESRIFGSITDTDSSQGIVVLAERPVKRPNEELTVEAGTTVYLSRVNNPSNLGAVIRAAEAAGATGLFTSPGSADPFSPKSLRSSMGSAFRLPIYTEVSFEHIAEVVRRKGIRTLAADTKGEKRYTEADLQGPAMFVFGSEAHGLDAGELNLVDQIVCVPMENGVESLNLAVSAGILLFEAKRQRESVQS